MKKVAVILSGCGVSDGSEIHEAVLTLLSLDREGAEYQCFAPDMEQRRVMNHYTGQEVPGEKRNVLYEAARIARGKIKDIKEANVNELDAAIFPGGFGAALNLYDFALKGADCTVRSDVKAFVQAMSAANKPVGFICIAPPMICKLYEPGVKLTIGNDQETVKKIEQMGGLHLECPVTECIVDEKHKVVSTPAYMLGPTIKSVAIGIDQLVKNVLAMTN